MQDILSTLNCLRRPPLLLRAARIGMPDYRRDVHLRRHLGYGPVPRCAAALARLIEIEADLDRARQIRATEYSVARHVDVLIAVMAEAQLLCASEAEPVPS